MKKNSRLFLLLFFITITALAAPRTEQSSKLAANMTGKNMVSYLP